MFLLYIFYFFIVLFLAFQIGPLFGIVGRFEESFLHYFNYLLCILVIFRCIYLQNFHLVFQLIFVHFLCWLFFVIFENLNI
jgi:hypothetical protein